MVLSSAGDEGDALERSGVGDVAGAAVWCWTAFVRKGPSPWRSSGDLGSRTSADALSAPDGARRPGLASTRTLLAGGASDLLRRLWMPPSGCGDRPRAVDPDLVTGILAEDGDPGRDPHDVDGLAALALL